MKGFTSPKILRKKLSKTFRLTKKEKETKKEKDVKTRDTSPVATVSQTEGSTTSTNDPCPLSPNGENESLFFELYGNKEAEDPAKCGNGDDKEDSTPIKALDLYKDAEPEDPSKYGYGEEDNTPINAADLYKDKEPEDPSKYGYGDDDTSPINAEDLYKNAPQEDSAKYGYGDESDPAVPEEQPPRVRTARRSSMKGSSGPRRRASIGYTGEIEVNLPGQHKTVKRRTSISFDEKVKVKSVAPVSHMTDRPEELWFQDDEYDRMKQKSFEIVDRVELGMTGGKKYCTRGLEKLMQKNQEASMIKKYDAWDSVLNEQYSQREAGTFDDVNIANALRFKTMNSQREANLRAQEDAEEIEKYVRTTRRMMRRMSM